MPNAPNLGQALKSLLPAKLPPSLARRPGNLYQVLSRQADGGVGKTIHQTRWDAKNFRDCYWLVTKARFKCEGKHGKAWGLMYWKGKLVSKQEERIRGGLKYQWQEGESSARACSELRNL